MSYRLTPENGTNPLIIEDKYIVSCILKSDPSNGKVRKIEQIHSAGAGLNLDFKVKINNQIYSANLTTKGREKVIIYTDQADSILDYELSAGEDIYGNPVTFENLRTEVIDKIARAGETELITLEKKIFGHQNRL